MHSDSGFIGTLARSLCLDWKVVHESQKHQYMCSFRNDSGCVLFWFFRMTGSQRKPKRRASTQPRLRLYRDPYCSDFSEWQVAHEIQKNEHLPSYSDSGWKGSILLWFSRMTGSPQKSEGREPAQPRFWLHRDPYCFEVLEWQVAHESQKNEHLPNYNESGFLGAHIVLIF